MKAGRIAERRPKRGVSHGSVETLRIDELAAGGRGVSRRSDGRVVFVDGTCPADLVEVEIDPARSGKSGAVLLRVLEPGPTRVDPPCAYYTSCGGCDWMHVEIGAQSLLHAEIVRGLLAHVMGTSAMASPSMPTVRAWPAPKALGYRTRARLHVKIDRRGILLGYLAARSHELVDIPRCIVLDPRLDAALATVRDLLSASRGSGEIGIGLGQDGKPVLDIRFDGELPASFFGRLSELTSPTMGLWAGARVSQPGALVPASFGDPRPVQMGADGAPIVLGSGGFAQSSDEGAALLAKLVDERASTKGKRVVELFSGSGTLSILLAREATSFAAVEIDPQASQAARENFAARGLSGKLVVADADAYELPNRTELVVLDPPRTGAKGATDAILRARVREVVYVSCDPATLARDLGVLGKAGYELVSIDTVELFPQTSHVETVVVLKRRRPGEGART